MNEGVMGNEVHASGVNNELISNKDRVLEALESEKGYFKRMQLASLLGISTKEVDAALVAIRVDRNYALASAPGRAGGYCLVSNRQDSRFLFCVGWVENWRESMGFTPPKSDVLCQFEEETK